MSDTDLVTEFLTRYDRHEWSDPDVSLVGARFIVAVAERLREQADEIDRLRGDHQSLMESFVAMERRAVVAEAALTERGDA